MMAGRNSFGVWSALMLITCERGTMMSRTCRSATWMAPSTMASASLSSSLFWWAPRSTSSNSSRFLGSWAKAWVIFPNQDFCPLIDRSSLMSLTRRSFGCPWGLVFGIGVGMTQFGQRLAFESFHLVGFGIIDVVIAQQVQAAVDDQVRPVRLQGLALFGGLACHHGYADHQVAQQRDVQ